MRIVKTFSDGSSVGWDRGKMDDWCVYYIEPGEKPEAPPDLEYFTKLQLLGEKYGNEQVYEDFVDIYDLINSKEPSECHFERVEKIAKRYPKKDFLEVDKLFTILWMAMISEWNYKKYGRPSKLQHRIKRLGAYMLLIEGEEPKYATTFMKKMHWEEINELCKKDGFELKDY